jgi:hypothetical protein
VKVWEFNEAFAAVIKANEKVSLVLPSFPFISQSTKTNH